MTIRELLIADWDVDRLEITVRDRNTKFITAYYLGSNVKPSRFHRYCCSTEAGDIYSRDGLKYIYIDKPIQFHSDPNVTYRGTKPYGVMLKRIPKKLLEMEVDRVSPYHTGGSDDLHGYRIDCICDLWPGIAGEDIKIDHQDGGES